MRRRDFLKNSMFAGAGMAAAPVLLGGISVTGFGKNSPFADLSSASNDNILVIVQLSGGNDGLNMIIPYDDPQYAASRKDIGITYPKYIIGNQPEGYVVIDAAKHIGMNGRMSIPAPSSSVQRTLYDMHKDGQLAVVQGVINNKTNPNRSHFRATDMWMSGSDEATVLDTGWFGRYLASENPAYPDSIGPNDDPLAIQIGYSLSMILYGPKAGMGITFANATQFYNLVNNHPGQTGGAPPPNTFAGDELTYVRTIISESQQYSSRIKAVAAAGMNAVTYPNAADDPRGFAKQLQVVAQMISGGAKTKLYIVSLGGFDTHAGQNSGGGQPDLLAYLSNGIATFVADLQAQPDKNSPGNTLADKVIGMTFSEFGRRVKQNGSLGTDHGTAAPMLLFGTRINGGTMGPNPSLTDLDSNGDLNPNYDYRLVYYSILKKWFNADDGALNASLNNWTPDDTPLDIIRAPNGVNDDPIMASNFSLQPNYPNPFSGTTAIAFTVNSYRDVLLKVFAENGREVVTLVNEPRSYGRHEIQFDANRLPAGNYIVKLQCDGRTQTQIMQVVR